ncbi:MAG: hexose kinase [Coriobacteriia bacterium]|nr:hexose kinase [Coriobacteriia bacterium]
MILTVTPNPSVDKVFEVRDFAPGSLNRIEDSLTQPGGKGVNIAFMLRALGHEITAMGFAGNGPGRFIQNSLRSAGITTAFTLLAGKTRTNYALLDTEAGILTKLRSVGPQVNPDDIATLHATFERLLGQAEMVVIAGSLPPGFEPTFCAELVQLATSRGVRVALNVREDTLVAALPARPFLAKPDLRDLTTYGEYDLTQREDRTALAQHLAESAEIAVVNADNEVICMSGDESVTLKIPACAIAGRIRLDDALMAGIIDATIAGGSLEETAREGVAAALAAAASPNGQFASREELSECLDRVEVILHA